jgi:3-methyladenine DNA glycosylase AlkD
LRCGDEKTKKAIFNFYIKHRLQVNNWDLVDSSADKIAGEYLRGKDIQLLIKLSASKNLWERRIAMISCFAWIKQGEVLDALAMAERLVGDRHDIIQKAVGWMLREIGKRELHPLLIFLDKHAATMPRTMLRYAIEKFSDKQRKYYLNLRIKE